MSALAAGETPREQRRKMGTFSPCRALMTIAIALVCAFGPIAHASQPVLQRGYDAAGTGATLTETTLTTSTVTPTTFGAVFRLAVDDNVYAQPLYVPNVVIQGKGTHNVVYVATMNDTLYAFDADVGGAALWSANFATPLGVTPVPIESFAFSGNRNIVGHLGILSTPVIDPVTHVMYFVTCTLEGGTLAYRLHAVDITSGAELYVAGGTLISGSYNGATFNARYQTQRASLVLSGNQVVFGFGAVELEYAGGYVGWVMAYNKQTLAQSGVFATVTSATGNQGGGVWQSGRAPAVDTSGFVYVFVGNGYGTTGYDGVQNFSESVLKLDPAQGLKLVDWFTPSNWLDLDNGDLDLDSSGPMLIPGTSLLAGGGKTGDLYVLSTTNLGHYTAAESQVVQKLHISASEIRGGPVYWKRSVNGSPLLYNWGIADSLKAYPFNGTAFATTPSAVGTGGNQIFPGGILALSANGETHGSGVLWATLASSGDAENNPPVPGEVHAFDAENVSVELWNSTQNPSRDGLGQYAKFVPPLVANGRVYVATSSNQVVVYGLLTRTLVVATSGTGAGTVTSSPAGVNCGATCSASFPLGSAVTLTATAASGSTFTGWSGAGCSGIGACVVTLSASTSVTAAFAAVSTPPPTVPAGLGAASVSATQVQVSWTPSTDVGGPGVAGYYVLRGGVQIATVAAPATTYTDSGLTASTTYSYSVAAFDAATPANVSGFAGPVSATTQPDTTPPSVPTGLSAVAASSTAVNLSWTGSTDNVGGDGVGGYRIYRNGALVGSSTTTSYADTGLAANTTYSYQVSAFDRATPANESVRSTPAVSVTTPVLTVAVRINAAGPAYTDTLGNVWSADADFNTGNVSTQTGTVAGTSDPVLYRTERWDDTTAPELQYAIPVPNGTYQVVLHFAEQYAPAYVVGGRMFDVQIQGATVFAGLDVYKEAGAMTALAKTATATVTNGVLTIQFIHRVQNPMINAIEVLATNVVADVTPPSVPTGLSAVAANSTAVSLSWTGSTDNVGGTGVGGYRIYRNGALVGSSATTSYADTGLAANTTYSYQVSAFDLAAPANESAPSTPAVSVTTPVLTVAVRINAAGPAYTDTFGNVWSADVDFNTGNVSTQVGTVAGTSDPVLYRTERWDDATAPELQYAIPVPNGTYQVVLHFAEQYAPAYVVGGRMFDVQIQGTTVFAGLDVYKEAGAMTALAKTATATVTNGVLNIQFIHRVQNPMINAIEVIGTGVAPPSTPTGVAATAVSSSRIDLTWGGSTDTGGPGLAGYRIYRNGAFFAGTTGASFSDVGLSAATTYSYQVSAIDLATPPNESAKSPQVSATTLSAAGTPPPTVPAGLGAASVSATQVQVSWTPSTDVGGPGVAGYYVLRGGVQIATVAAPATTYTDSGLTASTTYSYSVAAFDAATPANVSGFAGPVSATTQPDTTPPSVPTGLSAVAASSTAVNLSWTGSTDNVGGDGVGGYRIYRNGALVGSSTTTSYADTGLAANTTYSYQVSAFDRATPANESVRSTPAVSVTTPVLTVAVRINAAGPAYTDTLGNVWSADADFNTGNVSTQTGTVAGTSDPVLYRTERWDDTTAPELQYAIPVPNGTYQVVLHFAEQYAPAYVVGGRMFDVQIQGATVFAGLDVYKEAGAMTALAKTATATVTNGVLTIQFIHRVQNPMINAIEVLATNVVADVTPPSVPTGLSAVAANSTAVSLSWTGSTDNVGGTGVGGYRIYRNGALVGSSATTSYADTGLAANTTYSYQVSAFDLAAPANESAPSTPAVSVTTPVLTVAVRINAAGPAYTDTFGNVWSADVDFNTGNVSTQVGTVAGTSDPVLYRTERWDDATAPELQYAIPVPNGTYQVVLHFAEQYAPAYVVGGRMFDVQIQGTTVFAGLDVYKEAGAMTALAKTATATVTNGVLNIQFIHRVQNPMINAIEVIKQ